MWILLLLGLDTSIIVKRWVAFWIVMDHVTKFLHTDNEDTDCAVASLAVQNAPSEDSDQPARMRRLI